MKVVTSAEMVEIDRLSQERFGIPGIVLMEDAGLALWQHLSQRLEEPQSIAFVVGKGNNGGDGLVMARHCEILSSHSPRILLAGDPSSLGELPATHLESATALGIPVVVWEEGSQSAGELFQWADVIVDCLSGTGIRGRLRSPLSEIVDQINRARALRVAVDAPSGAGDQWEPGYPVVQADLTLTVGLPKKCLYQPPLRRLCGEIQVVPLSFPGVLTTGDHLKTDLLTASELPGLLPRSRPGDYKSLRGTVAVFAGSHGTTGAAVLASEAALSAGAGLVTLYTDPEVYEPLASRLVSVMIRKFTGDLGECRPDRVDAVVAGPGWGVTEANAATLHDLVVRFPRGVLDADALTLLAELPSPLSLYPQWVLTPHVGELARLLGRDVTEVNARFCQAAEDAARQYGCVVVAKSCVTVIAHPDGPAAVVDGMNDALGTGGTGDVLAGTIGALLCRCGDAWTAARAGVLVHGVAGNAARQELGYFHSHALTAFIGRAADGRLARDGE